MTQIEDNQSPYLTFAESAAPGTPASGLGVLYVKSDGKVYVKNDAGVESALDLVTGTSFPGAPATGDRFRRSDLDYQVYFYDGTRWLSEQMFSAGGAHFDLSATTTWLAGAAFGEGGLDVWVSHWVAGMSVSSGSHDGTDYWGVSVSAVNANGSGGGGQLLDSFDSDDYAPGTANWTASERAIGVALDVSAEPGFSVLLIKNASAGPLRVNVSVFYRYIAT